MDALASPDVYYDPVEANYVLEWDGSNGKRYTHTVDSLDAEALRRDEAFAVKLKLSTC
jgi:hypothetical protein